MKVVSVKEVEFFSMFGDGFDDILWIGGEHEGFDVSWEKKDEWSHPVYRDLCYGTAGRLIFILPNGSAFELYDGCSTLRELPNLKSK